MSLSWKFLILSLLFAGSAHAEVREIHWDYNFGTVIVGQSKKLTWALRAKDQDLHIKEILVEGSTYTFKTSCTSPLPPRERCVIEITARPPALGVHTGLLTVDLHGEKFLVKLSVEGQ